MCARCTRLRRATATVLTLAVAGQGLAATVPSVTRLLAASLVAAPVVALPIPPFAGRAWLARAATDENQDAGAPVAAPAGQAHPVKWTCPMHPHYIAVEYGPCPICGMDLVKIASNDPGVGSASGAAEGRTVITVAPEVIQNMGVRLAPSELTEFGRAVRSFGTVMENERLQTDISARVEGWVEELSVTAVGDEVEADQILFKLYSPQLVISQNDYIRSRGNKAIEARGIGQLRAFGVQDRALVAIRKASEPMEFVPFYATAKGIITQLGLRQGSYVQRGMQLARIQGYSSVWVQVSVAERDLSQLTRETPAVATFPSLQGREVRARIDYIYPTVDPKTRTGQVRLVVDNPDGSIRPGSYADVVFDVESRRRIAVPTEAILKNGDGRFVVASLGEGRFEPRAVETGLAAGRWTEIKAGVEAGEQIVVSGQFLLDSESGLREAFRKLQRVQTPLSLLAPTALEMGAIDHFVDAALYIHEALVDGYDLEANQLEPAIAARDFLLPRYKDTKLAYVLDDAVAALRRAQEARTVGGVQEALAALTSALRPWLFEGAPTHYREKSVGVFEDGASGRMWLQLGDKVANPYGQGEGKALPLPETALIASNAAAAPAETSDGDGAAPRGSGAGSTDMRGSH